MEKFDTGKISKFWMENPSTQSFPEYSSREDYIHWKNTSIWHQKFAF